MITEIQIAGASDSKEEFVELYNPNEFNVILADWYLQRKTETGSSFSSFVPSSAFTGKMVRSKDYLLIGRQGSSFANIADIVIDNPLTENNILALKNPNREIVDKVGWGAAQDFETAPVANPSAGKSAARKWNETAQSYEDIDNNSVDFEIQEPTPKSKNGFAIPSEPPAQPPPEPQPGPSTTDTTAPQVIFNLNAEQGALSFSVDFEITDNVSSATDGVVSGLEGFVLRWKEENNDWQEDPYQDIPGGPLSFSGQKQFTGQDGRAYYFQIKAKDVAGNQSDWLPVVAASTQINASKTVLINEIQIDSIVGRGGTDDDWVELYNPNDFAVSLKRWSIQKHSSDDPCSISIEKSFYKKNFSDNAAIPAKGFFLIVDTEAKNALQNIADMTIGWSLSDNNTIYLIRNQEPIDGGGDPDAVDKVGFGEHACFSESNPAQSPPESQSIERKSGGQDTNDNSQDFEVKDTPTPTNSSGQVYQLSLNEFAWPMIQHDGRHSGSFPFVGPSSSAVPQLQVLIGDHDGDYFCPPVIDSDNTLYFVARNNGKEGLFAFYSDGREKWYYQMPFSCAWPIIGVDGTIYILSGSDLTAIKKDGTLKWEKYFNDGVRANPTMAANGTIYLVVGGSPSKLVALDSKTGAQTWAYAIPNALSPGDKSPAVGQGGTIYFGNNDTLFAINPDGTEKWRKVFIPNCQRGGCSPDVAAPSVSQNGTIYVVVQFEGDWQAMTDQGYLHCLHAINPDGTEKWEAKCDKCFIGTSPTISSAGNIYLPGGYAPDGFWVAIIYGFDSQGSVLPGWPVNVGSSDRVDYAAVDGQETVYSIFGNWTKAFNGQGVPVWTVYSGIPGLWQNGTLSFDNQGFLYTSGHRKISVIKP